MARVPEGQEEMMDFCSENEIQFYEMDGPCLTKAALPGLTQEDARPHWACQLGIQVRISPKASAKGFRKAAIIVVAIEKMKKTSPGSLFTDKDLMDILNAVLEPVKFDTNRCTHAVSSIYQFSEEICCDIQDIAQKSLVLQKPPPQLLAMFLQGPNTKHAVKLKMSIYRPKPDTNGEKTPTALNIKGSNLYLSCVQKDGQPPLLQLEEATLRGDLDKATLGRFLFYRVHGTHTRFESALYPGWFICTSARSEAVGITNQPGGALIVDYDLTD
uniref:Interleukin-1 n=1 Tax=Pogona vitticeps TaxID=103695 RepID=A0ABM5EQ24_9SAUR